MQSLNEPFPVVERQCSKILDTLKQISDFVEQREIHLQRQIQDELACLNQVKEINKKLKDKIKQAGDKIRSINTQIKDFREIDDSEDVIGNIQTEAKALERARQLLGLYVHTTAITRWNENIAVFARNDTIQEIQGTGDYESINQLWSFLLANKLT